MIDTNTVINAFTVGGLCALAGWRETLHSDRPCRSPHPPWRPSPTYPPFAMAPDHFKGGPSPCEGAKAASLTAQANATQASMEWLLFNATSGLMVDGLYGAEHHSAWHAQTNALWFKTVPLAAKPKMLAWLLGRRVVGSATPCTHVFLFMFFFVFFCRRCSCTPSTLTTASPGSR